MAKEYFSHDYNARNDRKIAALVKDYKAAGYGIFWATCEMMHESNNLLQLDKFTVTAIAKDLNEDEPFVKEVLDACVMEYELFSKQDEAMLEANKAKTILASSRVMRNLEDRNHKKEVRVEAGRIGGIKSGESRRTKQNEANEPKERKGKENKLKEIKEIGIRPKQDFEIILPEYEIGKAIEFLSITKKIQADKRLVISIWDTFRIKHFTGEKFYKDDRDIFSHFFESLKFQQINGTHQQVFTNGIKKSGVGDDRIQALKNF